MFKYLVVLALALVVVMAAPPAPAPVRGPAPRDLDTANQLFYSYGAYPSVYSGYPYAYSGAYASPYYSGVYYG